MIDRENLGIVGDWWPIISIPVPVEDIYHKLVSRLAPEVQVSQVGTGYHNAGWQYIEIEVKAPSQGHAHEEAERMLCECMMEFQHRAEQAAGA